MIKTGLAWQTERSLYRLFMKGMAIEDIANLYWASWEYGNAIKSIEQAIRNEIARRERRKKK